LAISSTGLTLHSYSVAAEVRDNVFRMGSHASLGVYFSNNEMASGYSDDHQFFSAAPFYSALYFGCIAGNVSAFDPGRVFLSSTPSQGNETSAVPFNRQSSVELRGDMHFYTDASDCWNVSLSYPRARYVTEHGFISYPSLLTLAPTLSGPADYGFNKSVPASRMQHPPGQAQITTCVESNWRWPTSGAEGSAERYRFELFMTQVAAGACLRASIEFWRSTQSEFVNASHYPFSPLGWATLGGNAGVQYWQAVEPWPGPSWSHIELGGRWKAGMYDVQRSFAPVLVAGRLEEVEGTLALLVYFSRAAYEDLPSSGVQLRISAMLWSGGPSGTPILRDVVLPAPLGSALLFSSPLQQVLSDTDCPARSACVLTLDVVASDSSVIAHNFLFISRMNVVTTLRDPGLSVASVDKTGPLEFAVKVAAVSVPAVVVWLETPLQGRWGDNNFLMTAPLIQISFFAEDASVTAQQLEASLSLWSLFDTSSVYSSSL
jgi:beta-mannosidase